jgi:hypothetical protein
VQPDLPVTTLLRAGVGPVPDPRQSRLERQVDCTPMTLPENRIPPLQKRSRTHLTATMIHSTNVLKRVLRRVAALGRPAGTLWVLPRPGRPVTPTPTTPNRCPLPSQFVVGEQTRCPAGSGPTPDRRAGRRRRTPRPQKRSPLLRSGRGAGVRVLRCDASPVHSTLTRCRLGRLLVPTSRALPVSRHDLGQRPLT